MSFSMPSAPKMIGASLALGELLTDPDWRRLGRKRRWSIQGVTTPAVICEP